MVEPCGVSSKPRIGRLKWSKKTSAPPYWSWIALVNRLYQMLEPKNVDKSDTRMIVSAHIHLAFKTVRILMESILF